MARPRKSSLICDKENKTVATYVTDNTYALTYQDVLIVNIKNDGEVIITMELLETDSLE